MILNNILNNILRWNIDTNSKLIHESSGKHYTNYSTVLNSFMGRQFKPVREELERKYFAKLEWTSMVNSTWIE